MHEKINQLHEVIKRFLIGTLDANSLEKEFTEIYDFMDLNPNKVDSEYFSKVRGLLEHLSSSKIDLDKYPEYYIDEKELKKRLLKEFKIHFKE